MGHIILVLAKAVFCVILIKYPEKGLITIENTENKRERAVLAGLSAASMDEHERSTEVSMEELAALVDTAGGDTVAIVMQNRPTPDPRSFIGDGKVQ